MRTRKCAACGENRDPREFGYYSDGRRRRARCFDCEALGAVRKFDLGDKRSSRKVWPGEKMRTRCASCLRILDTVEFAWYREATLQRKRACRECQVGERKSYRQRLIEAEGLEAVRERERLAVRQSRAEQGPKSRDRAERQRRAYQDALTELRLRHLEEFDELYDAAKQALGLTTRIRSRKM